MEEVEVGVLGMGKVITVVVVMVKEKQEGVIQEVEGVEVAVMVRVDPVLEEEEDLVVEMEELVMKEVLVDYLADMEVEVENQ